MGSRAELRYGRVGFQAPLLIYRGLVQRDECAGIPKTSETVTGSPPFPLAGRGRPLVIGPGGSWGSVDVGLGADACFHARLSYKALLATLKPI
jgi:hypothetical protein